MQSYSKTNAMMSDLQSFKSSPANQPKTVASDNVHVIMDSDSEPDINHSIKMEEMKLDRQLSQTPKNQTEVSPKAKFDNDRPLRANTHIKSTKQGL